MDNILKEYWNVKTGRKQLYKPHIAAILLKRGEIEPVRKYIVR